MLRKGIFIYYNNLIGFNFNNNTPPSLRVHRLVLTNRSYRRPTKKKWLLSRENVQSKLHRPCRLNICTPNSPALRSKFRSWCHCWSLRNSYVLSSRCVFDCTLQDVRDLRFTDVVCEASFPRNHLTC